ncbi:hypothetical protein FB567DRAFT_554371 [Paraphoma chrysanthemicola]|uniref:Uncharacterized protein n=1 Tax=Paraphoma chrysanthemicola TaxID=798071 RepID=A0A8K0VSG4_9PLEO|nr:hypothetical protein FB567DRAFT_554371 [Paraphoma chrysanthemicola]
MTTGLRIYFSLLSLIEILTRNYTASATRVILCVPPVVVAGSPFLTREQIRTLGVVDPTAAGQLQKTNGASILPGGFTAFDFHYQPWLELHWQAGLNLDKHPLVSKYLQSMKNLKHVKDAYQKIEHAAEQQSVVEPKVIAAVFKKNDTKVA